MASDDLQPKAKAPSTSFGEDPSLELLELEVLAGKERRERWFHPSVDVKPPTSQLEVETKRNDEIRQFLARRVPIGEEENVSLPSRRRRRHPYDDPRVFRCVTDVPGIPLSITSAVTGDRVYCSIAERTKKDNGDDLHRVTQRNLGSSTVESVRQQIEETIIHTPPPSPPTHAEMMESRPIQKLWVHKYAPQTFSDLVTDDRLNREVMKWLKSWKAMPPRHRRDASSSKTPSAFKTPKRSAGKTSPAAPKITDFFQATSDATDHRPLHRTPLSQPIKTKAPTQSGADRRVLMLCGPVGVGKTCLVKIAAKMCGYQPFVIDASHDRSATSLQSLLQGALNAQSVFSTKRPNCVIFDEMDTLTPGAEARQTIHKIVEFIHGGFKKRGYLKRPMIFICQTPHVSYLASLRPLAKILHVPYSKINRSLVSRLQMICTNEQVDVHLPALHALVEEKQNDISACLHRLQFPFKRCPSDQTQTYTQQSPFQIWESILMPFRQKKVSFIDRLRSFEHFGEYELILKGLLRNYAHVHMQDRRFRKRQRIARWISNASHIVRHLSDHCPVLFAAIQHEAAASDKTAKIEWPREDFDAARHFNINNDAIQSFLTELHPNRHLPCEATSFVTDILPYALMITRTEMPSMHIKNALSGEHRLRLTELLALDHAPIPSSISTKRTAEAWWIRFHSEADRKAALSMRSKSWGNLKMSFEKKTMDEWKDGTYNHLMMKSYGNAIVVARLTFDTTPADLASFFRNFHLQGNGMTMLEDPYRPNVDEQGQFKRAIVRLISKQEAQRAARALHRKQLRTNRVTVRVLQ